MYLRQCREFSNPAPHSQNVSKQPEEKGLLKTLWDKK